MVEEGLSRQDFPQGFLFGVATSAYQIEGAALEDGRGMCIWDSFSHYPGNIFDGSTADVACDHYHKFKEDVQLMVDLGIDAYRFSISWSRLYPGGTYNLNQKGVTFYNKLINLLIQNGIEPCVTLYHWDLPQELENNPDIKGWRSKEIVDHFVNFAETCFRLFGDRVKYWITFNQPTTFALQGYGEGLEAPGRSSLVNGSKGRRLVGDSSREPYLVVHNVLLSHAAAVKVYKSKYQMEQNGQIGLSINSKWYEPYSENKEDSDAVRRCIEFELCWILDPLLCGDYPESMKDGVGDRLPLFTAAEMADLKGSLDFIGLNYYTSNYAKSMPEEKNKSKRWYKTDRKAAQSYTNLDGKFIGEAMGQHDVNWIFDCPWGLPKLLQWMEERYGKETMSTFPIIITENGAPDKEFNLPVHKALDDTRRIDYLNGTLQYLAVAIKESKYNVRGFFIWSLIDNFEWNMGLICRFGLYYVDYADNLRRYPKKSAEWYHNFLQGKESRGALLPSTFCLDTIMVCSILGSSLKKLLDLFKVDHYIQQGMALPKYIPKRM